MDVFPKKTSHGPHHVEAQFQKGHRRRDEDLAEHGQGVRASLTPTKKDTDVVYHKEIMDFKNG